MASYFRSSFPEVHFITQSNVYHSLYKNSNLQHAGNLQDRAIFSKHFVHLHEMLPYPLLETCKKYQEMSRFGKWNV